MNVVNIPTGDNTFAGMIRHHLLSVVNDWTVPVSVIVTDPMADGTGVRITGATKEQIVEAIDKALERVAEWRAIAATG